MKSVLLVAIGGAAGSVARWLLARLCDRWLSVQTFPVGILLVNVLGCLLIGLVLGAAAPARPWATDSARLLLATGLCGGFTTFSTFSHQTVLLLSAGRAGAALLYIGLSVGLSLLATACGLWLAKGA